MYARFSTRRYATPERGASSVGQAHVSHATQRRVPRRNTLLLLDVDPLEVAAATGLRRLAGRFFSGFGGAARHSVAVCPMLCTGSAATDAHRDCNCSLRASADSAASLILTSS